MRTVLTLGGMGEGRSVRGALVVAVVALVVARGAPQAAGQAPGMVLIPAGEFQMGDHHDGAADAPVHAVYVDPFHIDIYEVTNDQYAASLNWAMTQGLIDDPGTHGGMVYGSADGAFYCDTEDSYFNSEITWEGAVFGVVPAKDDHPVGTVTWFGAAVYANWRSSQEGRTPCYNLSTWECDFDADGYRLPTEAEWEYASRGGAHDPYYRYPWGDISDASIANYSSSNDPYECPTTDVESTPVGFYDGNEHQRGDYGWPCADDTFQTADGMNGYGLYDMGGNNREWCHDWYDAGYYGSSPHDNPRGAADGTQRVHRGGSYFPGQAYLRCAYRHYSPPWDNSAKTGFRLVLPSGDPIPTVSEWGMIVMSLLLLAAGTLVVGRRRSVSV